MMSDIKKIGDKLGFDSEIRELEIEGFSYQFVFWNDIIVDCKDVIFRIQNPVRPEILEEYADHIIIVDTDINENNSMIVCMHPKCSEFLKTFADHLSLHKEDVNRCIRNNDKISIKNLVSQDCYQTKKLSDLESNLKIFWEFISKESEYINFRNLRVLFSKTPAKEGFADFFRILIETEYLSESDLPIEYNDNRWLLVKDSNKNKEKKVTAVLPVYKDYVIETSMSNPRKKKIMCDMAENCVKSKSIDPIPYEEQFEM